MIAASRSLIVFTALLLGALGVSTASAKDDKPSTRKAPTTQPSAATQASYPRRSPFPEPGEKITTPIPFRVMKRPGEKAAAKAAAKAEAAKAEAAKSNPEVKKPATETPTPVVPWSEASRHLGETIVVEGKIIDAHNTGSVCFLNFSRNRDLFYVIIFKDALDSWSEPPQQFFLQKTIRVRGEVKENKGKAQIQVREANQIEVVP